MRVYLPAGPVLGEAVVIKVPIPVVPWVLSPLQMQNPQALKAAPPGSARDVDPWDACVRLVRVLADLPYSDSFEQLVAICPERCALLFPRAPGESLGELLGRCAPPPRPPAGAAPEEAAEWKAAALAAARAFPWLGRVRVALLLAEALEELHAQGVAHMDIAAGQLSLPEFLRTHLVNASCGVLSRVIGHVAVSFIVTPLYCTHERMRARTRARAHTHTHAHAHTHARVCA
jgi:hypothetical protein